MRIATSGAVKAAAAVLALLMCGNAWGQSAKAFVQKAVDSELAADKSDHSKWLFLERDVQPGNAVVQWVAQSVAGSVTRVMERNGKKIPLQTQRQQVMAFVGDKAAQMKQRQSSHHDDRQATALLKMLPEGFIWTVEKKTEAETVLRFVPNPRFSPPTREAKVFSAMAGEMVVNNGQMRIQSLRGKMLRDVTFGWWGILGRLDAGGTFDVERRETGKGLWQITRTHVHISGHALLFKTISEQEDDVKSDFTELPENTTLEQAAQEAMRQPEKSAASK